MELTVLLSFLSASILLALMPGPDNVFVLTESITKGKRNGIIVSAGLATGVIFHTLLIASGLSIFIQTSDKLLFVVKVLGALYLFYLAYKTYISNEKISLDISTVKNKTKESFFSLFKTGLLMNILNPKVTLFFIAFLPQFVRQENELDVMYQFIILGLVFMIQAFVIFSLIAVLADKLSQYLKSDIFWNNVKWVKIIVFVGLGIFLFF